MKYNFSEKNLGNDFCNSTVEEIQIAIHKGVSSTLLGMPLSGMITLCRYLSTTDIAYFAYVDTQSLKYKTRNDFFISLYNELGGTNTQKASINAYDECKKILKMLLRSEKRIVILIPRLDSLKEELSNGLLGDLKNIIDISMGRIVFIVTSRLPLNKINAKALDHNPSFLTDPIYFKPYKREDLKKLIHFLPGSKEPAKKDPENIFKLSGGHISLMWQLLKTDYLNDPMKDEIIRIHLQTIYDAYSFQQKSQIRKIALKRKIKNVDPLLIKVGLVKEINEETYELFTPLLRDYILKYTQTKLTKKERKLFYLLKRRLGRLVSKDTLFKEIWGDDPDLSSDWALNSLIYRLRKNPTFINQGYVIENEKDEGYRLIKEN